MRVVLSARFWLPDRTTAASTTAATRKPDSTRFIGTPFHWFAESVHQACTVSNDAPLRRNVILIASNIGRRKGEYHVKTKGCPRKTGGMGRSTGSWRAELRKESGDVP